MTAIVGVELPLDLRDEVRTWLHTGYGWELAHQRISVNGQVLISLDANGERIATVISRGLERHHASNNCLGEANLCKDFASQFGGEVARNKVAQRASGVVEVFANENIQWGSSGAVAFNQSRSQSRRYKLESGCPNRDACDFTFANRSSDGFQITPINGANLRDWDNRSARTDDLNLVLATVIHLINEIGGDIDKDNFVARFEE
jgi:hypothetical protein